MKVTIRRNRFIFATLFLGLIAMLCPLAIDAGWSQDKTGDQVAANSQVEDFLDLRGDVPNPRRIEAAEFHKMPRVELRLKEPHDPSKEVVYSGTPLVEVLKAGGLLLDADMASVRQIVAMTVMVEGADGYRAAFSLAELNPELTDRVVLLADTKDGQPLSAREGPFRIVAPGEKRPARWVRQVTVLTVRKN
jgi:DMSO/TMAO reductase YedYZ molybdopterin-dependent catalytic subunit